MEFVLREVVGNSSMVEEGDFNSKAWIDIVISKLRSLSQKLCDIGTSGGKRNIGIPLLVNIEKLSDGHALTYDDGNNDVEWIQYLGTQLSNELTDLAETFAILNGNSFEA